MGDDSPADRRRLSDSGEADGAYLPQLQGRDLARLIDEEDWHNDQPFDFQHRFSVAQYYLPPQEESGPRSAMLSRSNISSLAVSAVTRHTGSSFPSSSLTPSLAASSSTITSQSSLRSTAVGADLNRFSLHEGEDGILELPSGPSGVIWLCQYSFLGCNTCLASFEEWNTHCRAHCYPARIQECPFACCDWQIDVDSGETAWTERLAHISTHHQVGGTIDTDKKPSRHLIDHLLREGAINNFQRKELLQHGRLSGRTYTETANPRREHRERNRISGGTGPIVRRN